MRVFILAIAVICALPATVQDADELRIAREVLTRLQDQSFDKKREYCGYIGYDENGRLKASDPIAGTLWVFGCVPSQPCDHGFLPYPWRF